MKNLIFLIISIFLSGCAFRFQGREKTFLDIDYREEYIKNNPDLKEEWKETIIKGEIPLGIEKKDVEKILGKNYSIYISKT
ncbi:MAG: hypothetical protein N2589_01740, partial [bacterium]|nr:hypothetical protein [bacterium]